MQPIDREEFAAGVRWWQTKTSWPNDFHNNAYVELAALNPDGEFLDDWWPNFLRRLSRWRAVRPLSKAAVTALLVANREHLGGAWHQACAPVKDLDITGVTWEQVRAFPEVVARLKPTKSRSPVFPSKFCHFLLPRIFPVFDNAAVGDSRSRGGRGPSTPLTYEGYFNLVKETWAATPAELQAEFVAELTRLVEGEGRSPLCDGFPMATKITELALIGRRHA
ncbi:hypothetical protein [Plantactinospora soyae]|uniref:Uncharacterized protein n=1 Tax=Plantactinospora soyae TaxID=1544732 RepID=A0A927M6G7_9ACTN|nr:hypothetical protein [Plantactinospora soyae]MBE1487491.1 hypothetical protein [Plantactinospora soyae]